MLHVTWQSLLLPPSLIADRLSHSKLVGSCIFEQDDRVLENRCRFVVLLRITRVVRCNATRLIAMMHTLRRMLIRVNIDCVVAKEAIGVSAGVQIASINLRSGSRHSTIWSVWRIIVARKLLKSDSVPVAEIIMSENSISKIKFNIYVFLLWSLLPIIFLFIHCKLLLRLLDNFSCHLVFTFIVLGPFALFDGSAAPLFLVELLDNLGLFVGLSDACLFTHTEVVVAEILILVSCYQKLQPGRGCLRFRLALFVKSLCCFLCNGFFGNCSLNWSLFL